ncbi:MAG: hypothetical protein JO362_03295 [Streptomycetaceae bacterium]|nr:hypothetical protein [Streptomycetaceae bacterium]
MRHDPMQAAETIRQTGLYMAHAELGVPLGHQFLMCGTCTSRRTTSTWSSGRPRAI